MHRTKTPREHTRNPQEQKQKHTRGGGGIGGLKLCFCLLSAATVCCPDRITTAQIHHVDNARIFGGNDTREMELRLARHRDRSPLHTTRGLDPSQQRGSKTQAIIQDRKGMRDWITSLLRISRASPRNAQKGSPPATHCHIDRIHGHNPRRVDAVSNGPHSSP